MVSGFRRALDGGQRQSATSTQTEPSRGTIGAPVLTQWEQPETSCPCEVFQPGCRDVRAGQGANSDRSAEQCAHEEWGGYTRLPELSGSLEPCPQFLKNLDRSPITAQDEKMLSKLSSAPR